MKKVFMFEKYNVKKEINDLISRNDEGTINLTTYDDDGIYVEIYSVVNTDNLFFTIRNKNDNDKPIFGFTMSDNQFLTLLVTSCYIDNSIYVKLEEDYLEIVLLNHKG